MMPDLCEGCVGCPLADPWTSEKDEVGGGVAPPSGPVTAPLLVVGEAPGKEEVRKGEPFVGSSGRMLRAALQQSGIDPDTEVRYVNTVQCRPVQNADPEPGVRARCTVLEDELRRSPARVVLAVGRVAAARLLGEQYLRKLNKARSAWDGYVHEWQVDRVELGHELVDSGDVYKSGKRKGEPKLSKRLLSANVPQPKGSVGVVASLHPSAVMRSGFATKTQFVAAVQRSVHLALRSGAYPLDPDTLVDQSVVIDTPMGWAVPDVGAAWDLVFDIENTESSLTYISFVELASDGSGKRGQQASFPWSPAVRELTRRLVGVESPYRRLVAHNAAYDCGQLLAFEGVQVRGAEVGGRGEGLADSMMAAQIDQPDLAKGLGQMWRYCPPMRPWKHMSGSNMRLYNLLDSVVTAMAMNQLDKHLFENGQRDLLKNEMASIMVLDRMTRNGLPVNRPGLEEWIVEGEMKLDELTARWKELTGLTVTSGKQVTHWLHEGHEVPVLDRTDTGQPKLDASLMQKYAEFEDKEVQEAMRLLLSIKELAKQVSTYGKGYLAKLGDDGKLHPSYLPDIKDSGDLGTAAGRLSSSPNVQNVPKGMRWIFEAPEGWSIGDSDLRAVEGRVQAVLADDQELLEMYDRDGFDMHTYNLERAREALLELWEEDVRGSNAKRKKRAKEMLTAVEQGVWPIVRQNMKTFLYGWNYGAGDRKIAQSLEVPLAEAECIRRAYEASRPATARWRKQVVQQAAVYKRLQNVFGRIRYFPGVVPKPNVRNQAINFFPQSTVADMFWYWFPRVEELLHEHGGHLITQVHDSFVWMAPTVEVPNIIPKLDALMTQEWPQIAPGFRVPATHDVGPNWGEVEAWRP